MKILITLITLFNLTLYADFFKSTNNDAEKLAQERASYCKIFTQKALNYEKTMRDDELAKITLTSYKNRAKIYCAKETTKETHKTDPKTEEKPTYVKDISLEDERLCNIFQQKIETYKKTMRNDALAHATLASYKKRTQIFCSDKPLEKKEKSVRKEDKKLCNVFKQGPILCKKFDTNTNVKKEDNLSKVTLHSFQKRADVFCSSKPLNKKDLEVYQEHKRLCNLFNNKIIAYKKNMRHDALAQATLDSYKKRANYFCATTK